MRAVAQSDSRFIPRLPNSCGTHLGDTPVAGSTVDRTNNRWLFGHPQAKRDKRRDSCDENVVLATKRYYAGREWVQAVTLAPAIRPIVRQIQSLRAPRAP